MANLIMGNQAPHYISVQRPVGHGSTVQNLWADYDSSNHSIHIARIVRTAPGVAV